MQRKGGLFGGGKRVRRVDVGLGDSRYELEGEHGGLVARRRSVVRGIALKSEELSVEAWIDALSADLLTLAQSSERGRLALERLLTG